MRPFHKLRGYGGLTYPTHLIFTDTETTTITDDEEYHEPSLIVGVAQYVRLTPNGVIDHIEECIYRSIDDYWSFVDSHTVYNGDMYLYAHNWSFDFPVLDGFNRLSSLGYKLVAIVDESPPVILRYKRPDNKLYVIDTLNYFRQSLKTLGESVGSHKKEIDLFDCTDSELVEYCRQDVNVIRETMINLIQFLYKEQLSGLKHTVAALALSCYTKNFMRHEIYIDANPERVTFGRLSYFGGRTECFRIGQFEGPFYLIDVNSMYPFVMRNNDYPVRSFTMFGNLHPEDLDRLTLEYCVTAHVQVNTNIPVFPFKIDKKTCFPIGRFDTYLSTPEIRYGLENGLISKVYKVVLHYKARIFESYVDFFYTRRVDYRKAGNESYQEFCKKLMNSLYGKFGQASPIWEKTNLQPEGHPRRWSEHDRMTGKDVHYMEIDNVIWESKETDESRDSYPAIAAHVTAEGRILLQRTIDYIDRRHVFYCDTDSLLIDQCGFDKISRFINRSALGCWSLDGKFDRIDIRGLKDYKFGDKERIKGVKSNAVIIRDGLYRQLQFSTLKGSIGRGIIDTPSIRHVNKELRRIYNKGVVGADGVVTPLVVGGVDSD